MEFCSSTLFPFWSQAEGWAFFLPVSWGEHCRSKAESTSDFFLTLAFWKLKLLQGIMLRRGGKVIQRVPPNEEGISSFIAFPQLNLCVCVSRWDTQTLPNSALWVGAGWAWEGRTLDIELPNWTSQQRPCESQHKTPRLRSLGPLCTVGGEGWGVSPKMTLLLAPEAKT